MFYCYQTHLLGGGGGGHKRVWVRYYTVHNRSLPNSGSNQNLFGKRSIPQGSRCVYRVDMSHTRMNTVDNANLQQFPYLGSRYLEYEQGDMILE